MIPSNMYKRKTRCIKIMFNLYCQLFVNVLCDDSKIITHDGIFEEIETNQLELIDSQTNCYEKQKFNLYLKSRHIFGNDAKRVLFENNMKRFLNDYIETTESTTFKICSHIYDMNIKKCKPNMFLEFFQNAWYFNQAVQKGCKTETVIYEQYKYKIHRNLNSEKDFINTYNEHTNWAEREKAKQCTFYNIFRGKAFFDIILIDNCLDTIQDYELFYNEIEKLVKFEYRFFSVIFIALKLNQNQKQSFSSKKPWKFLLNEVTHSDTSF